MVKGESDAKGIFDDGVNVELTEHDVDVFVFSVDFKHFLWTNFLLEDWHVFGEACGVKFDVINLKELIDFVFGEVKFTNWSFSDVVQSARSSSL